MKAVVHTFITTTIDTDTMTATHTASFNDVNEMHGVLGDDLNAMLKDGLTAAATIVDHTFYEAVPEETGSS